MKWLWYSFLALFSLGMMAGVVAIIGVIYAISYFSQDLPDYTALKDYEPPVVTRVYAGDGRVMAEFAQEKRIFIPINEIPDIIKEAYISAEDKNFYQHNGIDYIAIMRAAVANFQGGRLQGASTITQQVAKNFLLSSERTYKRKIREAILAFRMERAMSKDRLLELYLNEIYLGQRSYGIGAAALNYFNKSLDEIDIAEAAYLAALPKGPNDYHPVRNHDAALSRRNWVINQMVENGYITEAQAETAKLEPLKMKERDAVKNVNASFYAEEIRRMLADKYGEESLYGGGLVVRASLDPHLQDIAVKALRNGLTAYDKRHGYRGPVKHFDSLDGWSNKLAQTDIPGIPPDWKKAVVLSVTSQRAEIGFMNQQKAHLELQYLSWARDPETKAPVNSVRDVLKTGDVIMVDQVHVDGKDVYGLRQIPKINGAIVAIDPHTGRVLAMQGGWSHEQSEFNRATQAWRQPGSAFKPFVYLSALDKGFTPATLILDAPFVIDQGPGLGKWRPSNYSKEYYGPTPMRVGIEKSRNLMTVRLADFVGMEEIIDYAKRFGVIEDMDPLLANALGAGETTLMRLTTGYAELVNGGKKLEPSLIDRIQDRRGKTIYRHDDRHCEGCGPLVEWEDQITPEVPDTREQIADPRKTYQIVSMLEGVVQRGTGVRIRSLRRPLAGKTGTTNESRDTWFIGFSPDLVVGVFAGFDDPAPLGKRETGSSVAVPIFKEFMQEALKDTPPAPFRIPPGVKQVQINANTGARAKPGDERVIWEAFITGTEPTDKTYILDGNGISLMSNSISGNNDGAGANTGTGGLY